MKISAISDVHVKRSGDRAEELLLAFLRHKDVIDSDKIFLLGDIFDLMIGPHSQYFARFQNYFSELRKLLLAGKEICYVEGNHDFHLIKLYQKFFEVHRDLDQKLFTIAPYFEVLENEKKYYFCHGDDIELNNPNYRLFKSIVTSPPLRFYANNLMPHFLIKSIGEYSSEKSRIRNNQRYSAEADLSVVKEHFRKSAEYFYSQNPFEIIVCGHSHVQDHYLSQKGFTYVNNGYAQHTRTFISIENGKINFKPIF